VTVLHVGLIDIDSKIPNLVLMKLSAWHKSQGHTTELLKPADVLKGQNLFVQWDKLYGAVVFADNQPLARKLFANGVEVGGTGWYLFKQLPDEVELIMPDYDLYGIDYGMGYLSRGCIRECGPCVVWRKEGYVHHVAWPWEIVNPRSKELVIMDGIFNGSPNWTEKAEWLIDNGYTVDITQGMDMRIISKRAAELIKALKHRNKVHFAFDHIDYELEIRKGIEELLKAGFRADELTLYVLVNYDSTFEQDMRRIGIIEEYGANPYVMIYNKLNAPKQIRNLQRWCNSRPPIRKVCRFEDYDPSGKRTTVANQS
jgi:hypothetical protein